MSSLLLEERQRSMSELEEENVKLRFKCKQQSSAVESLDSQLKKANSELADVNAQYEDSLQQVRDLAVVQRLQGSHISPKKTIK
jgi:septal ring factor EnvC (AmiA/AmiB activator)